MTTPDTPLPGFRPDISPPHRVNPASQPPGANNFPAIGANLAAYRKDGFYGREQNKIGQTGPTEPPKVKKRHRFLPKSYWKRIVVLLAVLIIIVGGWLGGKIAYNSLKVFKGNLFSLFNNTPLNGESTGRINILLAGNSADDPGHQGAALTDSIMIVSLDIKNNTAFMMSIPRDLWVDIPGYGHAKINEAYVDGNAGNFNEPGYPSGGMGLLEKTISQNLGITSNYYGLINYNAFRDAVNAVGGIDINIQSSDPRGLYDPDIDYATNGVLVKLSNGWHHLNGEQALDLARARGDAYGSYGFPRSDFDRTQHQRQMLLALKDKILSTGVLANPIKLSSLFDAFGNNVKTDFSLTAISRLYSLGKKINANNIQSIDLSNVNGKDLLTSYAAPNGESALIPAAGLDNFSKIKQYYLSLTTNNPVVKEAARVVILNATNLYGVAAKASQLLTAKNVDVVSVGDASTTQTTTTIIDNSNGKMPATKALLESLYGNSVTTTNPYSGLYNADFIVVVGSDHVAN